MRDPLQILSLGAGVQSSTLALMAARGVIVPMPTAAIFADTGDEPASVYAWLDVLEPLLPFPVLRVRKGTRSLSESIVIQHARRDGSGTYIRQAIPAYVRHRGRPRILTRGCTRDFKIRPIVTAARRLKRALGATYIVQWYGISTDEAARRRAPPEWDFSGRWPLIEQRMSRQDCLTWMREHGYPSPPRSACVYCPFHSDAEWARLQRDEPAEFLKAVAVERALQAAQAQSTKPTTTHVLWLTRKCQPLETLTFSGSDATSERDCGGHCGV